MKVEATVDVGDNITGMLERLAAQLGTTADKVFPWYVQQAYLDGAIFLTSLCFVLLVSFVALVHGVRKGEWKHGDPSNLAAVLTILGGALFFSSVIAGLAAGPSHATKVLNPQYHAMKMITQDIGNLVRK